MALLATAEILADQKKPATITRALSSEQVVHQYAGQGAPDSQAARAVIRAYCGEWAEAGLPDSSPAAAL